MLRTQHMTAKLAIQDRFILKPNYP